MAMIVALAVIKPWDDSVSNTPTAAAPSTRSAPATGTARPARDAYDPRLFGTREPDPAWELWPAGYVVEFGMSGPLKVSGHDDPGASSEPGPATPGAAASHGPASLAPSPGPGDGLVVDLGPADHLIALGINTPAEVTVTEIGLWILRGDGCCAEAVPFISLPTLWESRHFMAIGVEDPDDPGEAGPWQVGEYRLDLLLGTDEVREVREVRFRVTEPLG